MKKKTLVYPYDRYFAPILRHPDALKDYDICKLVSLKGWGMVDKDAAYADGSEDIGINVTDDFDNSIDEVETVIFTKSDKIVDFTSTILPKILTSIEKNKEIIISLDLNSDERNKILEIMQQYKANIQGIINNDSNSNISFLKDKFHKLYRINVPVILVMGIGERTDKFRIQLLLREKFKSMGYKVSLLASREHCDYLDIYPFPDFMYSKGYSEAEKIYQFNYLVKKIEVQDNPDAIIIGVPGGVMPINERFTENFGICAYEITQAVSVDAAVLSMHYLDYNEEYISKLLNLVKYRHGVEIDCIAITNIAHDFNSARESGMITYINVDSDIISKKVLQKEYDIPIYNLADKLHNDEMANYICDKLITNPAIQIY